MTPFNWQLAPRQTTNNRNPQQTPLFSGLRKPSNHAHNITVVGMERGREDAAKLQRTRGASR